MLDVVIGIVLSVLALAMVLALGRLVRGPTMQDRIVALDLIAVLTVGVIVTFTAGSGQRELLDGAIVIALVGFLGTVAYAWYVEKEAHK